MMLTYKREMHDCPPVEVTSEDRVCVGEGVSGCIWVFLHIYLFTYIYSNIYFAIVQYCSYLYTTLLHCNIRYCILAVIIYYALVLYTICKMNVQHYFR